MVELQNHWIVLTVDRGVSTFVNVTLLDIFEEAPSKFEAVFVATKH